MDYLEQFGSSSVSTCAIMAVFFKVRFSKGAHSRTAQASIPPPKS